MIQVVVAGPGEVVPDPLPPSPKTIPSPDYDSSAFDLAGAISSSGIKISQPMGCCSRDVSCVASVVDLTPLFSEQSQFIVTDYYASDDHDLEVRFTNGFSMPHQTMDPPAVIRMKSSPTLFVAAILFDHVSYLVLSSKKDRKTYGLFNLKDNSLICTIKYIANTCSGSRILITPAVSGSAPMEGVLHPMDNDVT